MFQLWFVGPGGPLLGVVSIAILCTLASYSIITPKHMLDNKMLLKLEKIFNSIEIIPNSTYPLSEPSVHYREMAWLPFQKLLIENMPGILCKIRNET